MKKGLMIVISGPAGCGKGTVNKILFETGNFVYSVSLTTRDPRPGEIDGKDYRFVTKEEFKARLAEDGMLEYTEYCGNFYGTPKKEAIEVLESGKNLILEIEVEGAANIKKKFPDAVLIMLLPPSHSVQEERLRGRGTEPEEKILQRLARAKEEIYSAPEYDYVVYNYDGKADAAAAEIIEIIDAENASIRRNPDVVKNFLEN